MKAFMMQTFEDITSTPRLPIYG